MLKELIGRYKLKRHEKKYKKGYNFAAGELLSGRTPWELSSGVNKTNMTAYDAGVSAAVNDINKIKTK